MTFITNKQNKKLNRYSKAENNICNKQSSDSFHSKLLLTLKIKQ